MAASRSTPAIRVLTTQGEFALECQRGETLRDILLSGGFVLPSACGGIGTCGQCQVRVVESSAIPVTVSERLRLTGAQLHDGVRLACQLIPGVDLHVSIEQPVAQMAWRKLRDDEYSSLTLPLPLRKAAARYGVAIDIGTTHLRLTLWDTVAGKRIAGRSGLNPQASYGADVLTRLMEAGRSGEVAQELGGLVQRAIAEALAEIALQIPLDLRDVGEVLIVGNTAMLSLLAGKNYPMLLRPENWLARIDCQPPDTTVLREAWGIGNVAPVRFVAPLGGFIGSDLLAGVIATRLIEQPAGSLLIDFGTNSEMALWDGHALHVTSAAGGPAFEGCGISCGMPGEAGAIYRVEQGGENGFAIRVLGGEEPKGLCGSGLVDAVAWLRRNGKLDKVGRFTGSGGGFVLHEGASSIMLKHGDIDALQRAKAAIGGGVRWLCRQAGLSLGGVRQVYACGAFGRLLDADNARQIGLLPPVPVAMVHLEGNTALAGCETLLLSVDGERALETALAVCKVYNLADDEAFEALFVENLYLQPMQE